MSITRSSPFPIGPAVLLLLASPARLSLLVLLILNRNYLASFLDPETRQRGLPVLLVILVLAAASYPAMLACMRVFRSGRRGLSVFLAALVFLAFEIPAVLMLLLAPAALALISCIQDGICPGQTPPLYFPSAFETNAITHLIARLF